MDWFDALLAFLETGGEILKLILLLAVALWSLIIERFLYLNWTFPRERAIWIATWQQRADKQSAYARHIRRGLIAEAHIRLNQAVPMIKVLITLCPLLGLLGTVTGMIHVFDVMAILGTGNPRAMASGVSKATIPTMAGMVIAIAGLYCGRVIEERVNEEIHHLADLLKYQ